MTSDNGKLVQYDIRKKSMGVAYLFWFFLGSVSAHRFYTGNLLSAFIQFGLLVFSSLLLLLMPPVGGILFSIWVVWILLDIFFVARNVKRKNLRIAERIGITV